MEMCFCRRTCTFWLNGVREGGGEGVGGGWVGGGWMGSCIGSGKRSLFLSVCHP